MTDHKPNDLITLTEARRILNISQAKVAQLVRDDVLSHWTTPLDARKKLVSRKQVEALIFDRRAA